MGPPWGHRSCQQTCSSMGFSFHGSTGPARSLLQHGPPMGSQPPLGIHLLRCGVLHGLQVDSLPHYGLLHGLQGSLCSSAWNASSPYFFTDLGVCRVVSLTYSLSYCSYCCTGLGFFPLLKCVIPETLPPSLTGLVLASAGSVLEPAGIASVGHGEASSSFSQKPPL